MPRWPRWAGRPRLGAAILVTLCVGLLGAYGLNAWRQQSGTTVPGGAPQEQPGLEITDVLPVVTRPETILRFESFHVPCRMVFSHVELAGRERAGFTEAGLAAILVGWSIRQFDDGEVIVRRDTEQPCPDTGATFTLGIAGGRVVVYRGEQSGGEVYAEVGVAADDLLPGDRTLLERGVVLVGERQIWQYMEGLSHGGDAFQP